MKKKFRKIKALRKSLHLTQKEMAGLLGISREMIAQIEIGAKPVSPELAKMAQFETTVHSEWLLSDGLATEDEVKFRRRLDVQFDLDNFFDTQSPAIPIVLEKIWKLPLKDLSGDEIMNAETLDDYLFQAMIGRLISVAKGKDARSRRRLFLFHLKQAVDDLEKKFKP